MAKRKQIKTKKRKTNFYEKYEDMSMVRRLERKLDRINHIMELIRTICPIIIIGLQVLILIKFPPPPT